MGTNLVGMLRQEMPLSHVALFSYLEASISQATLSCCVHRCLDVALELRARDYVSSTCCSGNFHDSLFPTVGVVPEGAGCC